MASRMLLLLMAALVNLVPSNAAAVITLTATAALTRTANPGPATDATPTSPYRIAKTEAPFATTTSSTCPPNVSPFPSTCPVSGENCNFYSCLEDKYHCGENGYPLGYGYKYCELYSQNRGFFSAKGQEFIRATRLCLQNALLQVDKCKYSCDRVQQDAFASHANCYVQAGFCSLSFHDYVEVFKTIKGALNTAAFSTSLQGLATGTLCLVQKGPIAAAAIEAGIENLLHLKNIP